MDYGHHLLGLGVSRTLQERAQTTLFQIGSDKFTRGHLAKVDCYNFMSAQNPKLAAVLNEELIKDDRGNVRRPRNTRDLFYNVPPQKLARPGIGSFTLAVLGACFEAKGLGGEEPLRAWVEHHDLEDVTFNTLKIREVRENDPTIQKLKAKQQAKREAAVAAAEDAKARRQIAKASKTIRRVVNA